MDNIEGKILDDAKFRELAMEWARLVQAKARANIAQMRNGKVKGVTTYKSGLYKGKTEHKLKTISYVLKLKDNYQYLFNNNEEAIGFATKDLSLEITRLAEGEEIPGPTINANDRVLKLGDEFNVLEGITASDAEGNDITEKLEVIENTVDTQFPCLVGKSIGRSLMQMKRLSG